MHTFYIPRNLGAASCFWTPPFGVISSDRKGQLFSFLTVISDDLVHFASFFSLCITFQTHLPKRIPHDPVGMISACHHSPAQEISVQFAFEEILLFFLPFLAFHLRKYSIISLILAIDLKCLLLLRAKFERIFFPFSPFINYQPLPPSLPFPVVILSRS